MRKCCAFLGVLFVVAFSTVWRRAYAEQPYFKGKTISIIVGFDKGGGVDEMARIFASMLPKYIPGNPKVEVRNMPDEARAQNYIYENAPKDGTEIGFNTFGVLTQLIRLNGTRYNYDKLTYVAALKSAPYMVFARIDAAPGGLEKPEDIMKANDLRYTGRIASHTIDAVAIGAMDILGLKYTYLPGHNSSQAITSSILDNETNITGSGLNMWLDFVIPQALKKGLIIPLWQYPFITPDGKSKTIAQYGQMPTFRQLYKSVKGRDPSGPNWDAYSYLEDLQSTANFYIGGPPDMDPDATRALRQAFVDLDNDPKMIAISTRMMDGFRWYNVSYDEAKPLLDRLGNPPDAYVQFWKDKVARLRAPAPK